MYIEIHIKLKKIRNLGIRIIRIRVVFRLFQIDWNQHKSNRRSKEIELGHGTMYIIYGIDIYI